MENITLRDYFAAQAMAAIIAKADPGREPIKIAKWAYEYADAMVEISNLLESK